MPAIRTVTRIADQDDVTTWAGSTALVTVGTIATGTWHGTMIADAYIASAGTWNAKLSPAGDGSALTGITEGQVAGLTSDLAAINSSLAGKVSSISLTTPSVIYTSPVTWVVTSGAAAATLALVTQTANTIFAGPTSGGAATPTFRALVAADIPNHSAALLTSGTVAVARGGTGLTTIASGKLLYASALDTLAALTLGTNLSITSGTLNATSGGGGLTIGGAVSGGSASKLLAEDASQNLATGPGWDDSSKTLTGGTASAGDLTIVPTSHATPGNLLIGPGTAVRVGIGTTTPASMDPYSRFTIEASDAAKLAMLLHNTGAGQAFLAIANSTGAAWSFGMMGGDAGLHIQYVSGMDAFYCDNLLNTQFGGNSPQAKVHVISGAAATPVLITQGITSQSAAHHALRGQSSTTAGRDMGSVDAVWSDSTDATRKGDLVFSSNGSAGAHEGMRFRDTGAISQPIIPIANVRDAADDTAAAALSPAVPVGGFYRTASVLKIRVT